MGTLLVIEFIIAVKLSGKFFKIM